MINQETSTIVVQRQTLDWSSMTEEKFRPLSEDFCRLWGKPADYVFRLMQLWNKTFSVDYFHARAELKAIALRNVQVSDAVFIPYQNYKNIPDQNGFYVFLDDDDWVAPDIAAVLAAESPEGNAALLWRTISVGSPQQEHPVFIWGLNGRCMTNNYAVSGVWLDHLKKVEQVVQHSVAERTLAFLPNIKQLDVAVSASNKSPCSSVSLERGLQGDLSSENLARLVDEYLKKMAMRTPEHLWMGAWAAPWIEETVAFFQAVNVSRIR